MGSSRWKLSFSALGRIFFSIGVSGLKDPPLKEAMDLLQGWIPHMDIKYSIFFLFFYKIYPYEKILHSQKKGRKGL
jgi:hypothetical protein